MILASDISIGEAGVYALLGYAVVFFGIVLLMIVITAFGKYFASKDANLAAAAASAPPAGPPPQLSITSEASFLTLSGDISSSNNS